MLCYIISELGREENEDIWHTHAQTHSLQNKKEEIFMTITPIFVTVFLAFLTTFFSVGISFAISKHLSCSWVLTLGGEPNAHSRLIWATSSPVWIGLLYFPTRLIKDQTEFNIVRHRRGFSIPIPWQGNSRQWPRDDLKVSLSWTKL